WVKPTADDIFVDLGSGLGQVPILLHLLTGIPAHGVEIEAGYVRFARASAEQLGLSAVTFEQADARDADMAGGTIFYLYTPFRGAILRAVLDRLALQAQSRPITVCAYGPCATDVERETWLRRVYARGSDEGAFAVFASRR